MDTGIETITDAAMLNALRAQARRVRWKSLLAAALLTALYLVVS